MVQAGLLRRPKRAINQITDRGLTVLRDHPNRVDNQILDQFDEFRDFRTRARTTHSSAPASDGREPLGPGVTATAPAVRRPRDGSIPKCLGLASLLSVDNLR
jgi:restriction system protein